MNERNIHIKPLIGATILLIPLALFVLWIYAYNQTNRYPENVQLYNSYFPKFLSGRFTITIVSLVLCIAAVTLNIVSLKSKSRSLRVLSVCVIVIGCLLAVLDLFSVM